MELMLKLVFLDHVKGPKTQTHTNKRIYSAELAGWNRFLLKRFCNDISNTDSEYASHTVTIDVQLKVSTLLLVNQKSTKGPNTNSDAAWAGAVWPKRLNEPSEYFRWRWWTYCSTEKEIKYISVIIIWHKGLLCKWKRGHTAHTS